MITDETVAFAAAARRSQRRRVFWLAAAGTFVPWIAGTAIGALAGAAIPDATALGLDVAFPAAFTALLVPLLRDRAATVSAAAGAATALALTPVLPAGLPVVVALGVPLLVAALWRSA